MTKVLTTLTLRKEDYERYSALFNEYEIHQETCPSGNKLSFMHVIDYEAQYAELSIEKKLDDLAIPYDKSWQAKSEFEGGEKYTRYLPNGVRVEKCFYGSERECVCFEDLQNSITVGVFNNWMLEQIKARYIMPWPLQSEIMLARKALHSRIENASKQQLASMLKEMEDAQAAMVSDLEDVHLEFPPMNKKHQQLITPPINPPALSVDSMKVKLLGSPYMDDELKQLTEKATCDYQSKLAPFIDGSGQQISFEQQLANSLRDHEWGDARSILDLAFPYWTNSLVDMLASYQEYVTFGWSESQKWFYRQVASTRY